MALTKTPTDVSPAQVKGSGNPALISDIVSIFANTNAPDNRPMLIHTYGDQNLTGFLKNAGAITNMGNAPYVDTWEETRLHPVQVSQVVATSAAGQTRNYPASTINVRLNDVVILEDGETRAFVTAVSATGFRVVSLDSAVNLPAISATGNKTIKIVGNMYGQGTDQPTEYFETNVKKRQNGFFIIKDSYVVTGTQATNTSWFELPDGRKYHYLLSQMDTVKRFNNWRETMLLLGNQVKGAATANIANIEGSEGYFSAIEDRGIVSPKISALSDIDALIDEFDRQGGVSGEYSMFLGRDQSLAIDDLLATGLATGLNNGLPAQFGTFNNSADMAVKLGFKSWTRGDYSFHKTSFKLLNEETMLKDTKFKGVIVPTGTGIYDGAKGSYCPSLEMNYKSSPTENRLMKSWITGSMFGATNSTKDLAQFNYLSEVNLVTRATNQHTLIKY